MSLQITRYGTRMVTQQGRQEIIANLAEMVQSLLEQFRKEVRIQPEQVGQDGSSNVLDLELTLLLPQLIFLCVYSALLRYAR